MPSPLTLLTEARVARTGVAVVASCCVAFAVAGAIAAADTLAAGAKDYKAFAAEKIGGALAGGKSLQAAIKGGDAQGALGGAKSRQGAIKGGGAKAARAAWIAPRGGWEAAEPITGEFFPKLDEAIDAWPDAKQGDHAIEAALF